MKAYPLHWPDGWARTPASKRRRGQFRTTLGAARDNLLDELARMDATHIVVSTDQPLRRDGNFYASTTEKLDDPGVAAFFQWRGKPYALACDSYESLHANVRALALTIAAMRAIERHGATQLLERAVSGFAALPAGEDGPAADPWWTVLNVPKLGTYEPQEIAQDPHHPMRAPLLHFVEANYRELLKVHHPDRGGSVEEMARLNRAIEDARQALE